MAEIILVMPKMGESVMEGTILNWLKQPGDTVSADESVLEVATDKVDTEVPASQGGVLKKILVQKGGTVPVGQPIAVLETEASATSQAKGKDESKVASTTKSIPTFSATTQPARSRGRFYSPLVRSYSTKRGSLSRDSRQDIWHRRPRSPHKARSTSIP